MKTTVRASSATEDEESAAGVDSEATWQQEDCLSLGGTGGWCGQGTLGFLLPPSGVVMGPQNCQDGNDPVKWGQK